MPSDFDFDFALIIRCTVGVGPYIKCVQGSLKKLLHYREVIQFKRRKRKTYLQIFKFLDSMVLYDLNDETNASLFV